MDLRHATRLAAAATITLSVTACGPAASTEETERNRELVDEVVRDLRDNDAYATVEGSYSDDATNQAKVFLEIECADCRPGREVEEAVSKVWLSEITPLLGFNISVVNTMTNQRESVIGGLRTQEEELIREYGERPVDSLPDE